jgi:sRNA-binding protein
MAHSAVMRRMTATTAMTPCQQWLKSARATDDTAGDFIAIQAATAASRGHFAIMRRLRNMSNNPEKTITALAARFPSTFVADPVQSHRPLKIGIGSDLVAAGFPAREANAALKTYTGRPAYQRVVATGGYRIDLDGNVAGEVTDGQRRYAEARARRLEARQSAEAVAKANGEGPKATGEPAAQTATPSVRAARVPTVKDKPVTVPQAPATPPAPPRSSDGRLGLADLKRLARERKQRALEEAAACLSV